MKNILIITLTLLFSISCKAQTKNLYEEGGADFEENVYFKDIPNCGSCDKITIPRGNLYIQAKADGFLMPELYPVGNFDTNPFNPITSTDLVFDFPNTPNFNTYYTLYIDNNIY